MQFSIFCYTEKYGTFYLSRIDMRTFMLWLILPTISLLFLPADAWSKAACKKHLTKIHNIQAKQRQGHSFKRSITLKEQESRARKKWWQCEKSPKSSKVKRKKKNNKKIKTASYQVKVIEKTPVFSGGAVYSVKALYQGKKKSAWLAFYQQPAQCKRPKKLSVFALCTEDKLAQQVKFDQSYQESQ